MTSILTNLQDSVGQPLAGELPATQLRRAEFTIGNTTCYDVTQSSAREQVIDRLNDSFPHIVRVVGSLPGSSVVSMVRKQLLRAFAHSDVGAVLIGGNETVKVSSPGERVDSIPGLAAPLQQLSYRSSLYGNMLDVYGTLPIGRQSIVTGDTLDVLGKSEPDHRVIMQRDLKRALVFPTFKENVWMAEAEGVVHTIDSFLRQNPNARYTVIMAGGGKATELEYQETQSLLSAEFGDRVCIIPMAGSGGFSDRLARSGSGSNCVPVKINSGGLKRILGELSTHITRTDYQQEQLVDAERRVVAISDGQRRLAQTGLGAPKSSVDAQKVFDFAFVTLHQSGILEQLASFSDRVESQVEPSASGSTRFKERVLSGNYARLTLDIQSLNLRADDTGSANPLLPGIVNALQRVGNTIYRDESAKVHSDLTQAHDETTIANGGRELADRLFSSLNVIRDLPSGQIIGCAGQYLTIIDEQEGGRALLSADGSIYPAEVLAGMTFERGGDVTRETLSGRPLQSIPESVPAWECLESNGGLIRFKDAHGRVVGHREILSIEQAKAEVGELPRSIYRLVTALDVTYEPKITRLIRDIEHVNSLIFPPADKPDAVYVEIFPFAGTVRSDFPLPPPFVDRSLPSRVSELMKPVREIAELLEMSLIEGGVALAMNRVQYLAKNPNSENMSALTGEDPVFESLLGMQRENATLIREFTEIAAAIFEDLSRTQPAALTKIVATFESQRTKGAVLPQRFQSLTAQISDIADFSQNESLRRLTSALIERSDLLKSALSDGYAVDSESHEFASRMVTKRTITRTIAEECAQIASQSVINFAAGDQAEFYKLKSGGGTTTTRYTSDYIMQAVQSGARLVQIRNSKTYVTEGFCLYFPPAAISEKQREVNPLLKNPGYGYYDLVCMRQGSQLPTGSLMAIRSALVDLQYRDADFLAATIHQWNEASMKSALRDRFAPVSALDAQIFTKQVGNGFESRLNSWKCPVSPAFRESLSGMRIDDRRERMALINNLKAEGGGFLHATQEERRQMKWVANADQDLPFIRLSVGVASMTEKSRADFQYLIDQGTFSDIPGVFCLASGREASRSSAGWVLHERGPHEIMQRMKGKFHPDSTCIGLAVTDTKDRNFGESIEVTMPNGDRVSFPVAYTETEDGSKVTVVDRRDFPVISSPVTKPEGYKGNLGIFHIEQLRAREFGEMFKSQLYIFTGGGGVNAWYIKDLVESLSKSENTDAKVVLLKGFDGSTDKLAQDIDWCRQYQSMIDRGQLIIIEPLASEEQRLELKQILSEAAQKAKD